MTAYEVGNTLFNDFPLLNTDRLTLRNFHSDDTPFLYKIRSDEKIAESAGIRRHCDLSETKKLMADIEKALNDGTGIEWVLCLKEDNTPVGYAGIWKITKEHNKGELGYALRQGYTGKGYMAEALKKILNFGFNKLKLHRLEANTDSKNTNSIKLLKKLGFKQEAFLRDDYFLNGKYSSSVIFSKLENES